MGKIEELYQEWQSLQPIKEEYLQRPSADKGGVSAAAEQKVHAGV